MQISLVISSGQRKDKLQLCLQSVQAQSKAPCEILILQDAPPRRLEGFRRAQGEWVLFLDEDVVLPDSEWLRRLSDFLTESASLIVVGGSYRRDRGSYGSRAYNFICDNWLRAGFAHETAQGLVESQNLLGGVFALNKTIPPYSLAENLPPFWGGEDTLLFRHLRSQGVPAYYCPSMDVWHFGSSSLKHFLSRAFVQGQHRHKYGLKTQKPHWSKAFRAKDLVYIPLLILHQLTVELGSLFS